MNLINLKSLDDFTLSGCKKIVETLGDGGVNAFNRVFKEGPDIVLVNNLTGEKLIYKRSDIVDVVQKAIEDKMQYHFSTYFTFVKDFSIIYLLGCKDMTTMAVDDHMNLYIDAVFIARDLKMDPNLICAVLMHEIFHVVYNHVERSKNWLSARNLPLNKENMLEMNMAGDIEVNTTLVRKNIISIDRLVNEIHGLYLKEIEENILPMEEIRENEKYMNKLRNQCNPPENNNDGKNGEEQTITTTKEFDEGYVEMMNKIADMVNEYGAEETLKRLGEIGAIIDDKVSDDFDTSKILSMNFLTIKNFDEFILEENQKNQQQNGYSTKEDGYRAGLKKCIEEIKSALGMSPDSPSGQSGQGGQSVNINSNIDPSLLKRMNLPQNNKEKKGKKSNGGNGLPSNVEKNGDSNESEMDDNNQENKQNKSKQNSGNGDQKGDQKGDQGYSLRDYISNRNPSEENGGVDITYGSGNKKGELDETAVGKTGSFFSAEDESVSNSIEEAIRKTYVDKDGNFSKELFDEVMEEIEENRTYNTKEIIEQKREDFYNNLDNNDPIKIIWKEARKSESQYKAMWKKLLRKFLNNKTRYARKEVESDMIKYMNARKMSIVKVAPTEIMIGQDVQDINFYVDTSGSINMQLVTLFVEALVTFMETFKYTGINIGLWADSKPVGPFKVNCSKRRGKKGIITDIIDFIEKNKGKSGNGTDFRRSGVPMMKTNIEQYKRRKKKDDVHIILTDGYLNDNTKGLEDYIENYIGGSIGKKAVKNCLWVLYDNFDDNWDEDIKQGTVIRVSSKNFIPE